MRFRVEIKTHKPGEENSRLPSAEELRTALLNYSAGDKGIVTYHNSFYDYQYDTKLNNYHSVDSIFVLGRITNVEIIGGKVYIVLDCNDAYPLDENDHYICYYRAIMESNPLRQDNRLHFTNLFTVDIIHIADEELKPTMNLSTVELISR